MAGSSNPPASRRVSTAASPAGPLSSLRENQLPPVGLINFQNSCYLNSVLQCLTFTPPLAEYCLRQLHSTSCPRREECDCTFCILEEQIRTSLRILNTTKYAPEKLYLRMMSYSDYFQPENQGDAHELLRFLIDDCGKGFQTSENQHQQQPVLEGLFGGVLQNQIECQHCGARSTKHDDMLDISLEVIRGLTSLAQAFAGFFRPEVLDGDNKYHCESCNEFSAAEMRMSIQSTKIAHNPFEEAPGDPQYTLYAVIVHDSRSLYEGHYYAFVKETNGQWYKCTDETVTDVEERRVLAAQAYLLFYIRSDTVSQ